MINKFIYFFKLIRIQNLIILFLIQFLLHYFLFENQGNLEFYLLASITFLITAAGYIINDIFDVESDKINKEEVIIGNQIPSRLGIFWYYLFNSAAIVLSFYLVYCINNYYLLIIFFSSIFVLRWYSKTYKHKFIIGNLIVSNLTSLSIFNVYLFCDHTSSTESDFQNLMTPLTSRVSLNINVEFYATIIFVFFSFFLTLSREIIKDLEDKEGDELMNSENLALTFSLNKVKWIVSILLIIVLIPLLCILVSLVNEFIYFYSAKLLFLSIYCSLICFLIIYTIYKIKLSEKKPNFTRVSQLLKFIMILGIFSVPLFFYFL